MHYIVQQLLDVLRKNSKVLLRDYYEIEHLLSGPSGASAFAAKSYGRSKEFLMNELKSIASIKSVVCADINGAFDKARLAVGSSIESNYVACVIPIDGLKNFEKALPHFGSVILLLQKDPKGGNEIVPFCYAIEFPALNKSTYSWYSGGAWVNIGNRAYGGLVKAKASGIKTWDSAYCGLGVNVDTFLSGMRSSSINFNSEFIERVVFSNATCKYNNFVNHMRQFHSTAYHVMLFSMAKLDTIIIDGYDSSAPIVKFDSFIFNLICRLLSKESLVKYKFVSFEKERVDEVKIKAFDEYIDGSYGMLVNNVLFKGVV